MIKMVEGWMINERMPTGETTEVEWNGKILNTSIIKFTFMRIMDFDCKEVIYDTSEKGAWEQLKNRTMMEQ